MKKFPAKVAPFLPKNGKLSGPNEFVNFLKPVFEYSKIEKIPVPTSGYVHWWTLSFSEIMTDSKKHSWFSTFFNENGLPDIKDRLKEVLGSKNDNNHNQIRSSIESLSSLYSEIRNFHNIIYNGLFKEPTYRDIPGFEKAIEHYTKKTMKKPRANVILQEADKIKSSYDDIVKRLDKKLQDMPQKRYAYYEETVSKKDELRNIGRSKDETIRLVALCNIVAELKEKLEALKNLVRDASAIVDELNVQRPKWAETLMGESFTPKVSRLKLKCFEMPRTISKS
ncbi:uncharacterized protein LOC116344116 isoform X2 [Contarinia nasturtii]|nr:uncharacterized protein LOC116344116 isoform X2 [Contarinia nasturtii]